MKPLAFVSKFALVLSALLLVACGGNESAPRVVTNAEQLGAQQQAPSTAMMPKETTTGEKAIANVLDLPIAKHAGGVFKLTDLRGKVVVVDFWGTFCAPCLKQVPQLVALSKKYKDQGLEIVGLSMDDKQADQKLVSDFIKKYSVSYTIAYPSRIVTDAFLEGTKDDLGPRPIPQLFIFGRDGKLLDHLVGERPDKGISYVEQVVAQQLKM